jgi:hypothetical protein
MLRDAALLKAQLNRLPGRHLSIPQVFHNRGSRCMRQCVKEIVFVTMKEILHWLILYSKAGKFVPDVPKHRPVADRWCESSRHFASKTVARVTVSEMAAGQSRLWQAPRFWHWHGNGHGHCRGPREKQAFRSA